MRVGAVDTAGARRNALAGAWILMLGVSFFLSVDIGPTSAQFLTNRCGHSPTNNPTGPPLRGSLSVASAELPTLQLGRSREPRTLLVGLTVSGCQFPAAGQALTVRVQQFRGDRDLIAAVQAIAVGKRDHVLVETTLDPGGANPGAYTGKISVTDPSVIAFEFQVRATLQYPGLALVVLLAVLATAGGISAVWLSGPFGPWHRSAARLIAALGGAVGSFYATYWRDPTWENDAGHILLLIGAVGSATIAAMIVTSVLSGGDPVRRARWDRTTLPKK